MTWSPVSLSAPLTSASDLVNDVPVVTVSPWAHGIKEGSGMHTYLSFPNAVAAVVDKIGAITDAVFIIAITAANEADFSNQAGLLNAVFPLKQLQSWQKQAASLARLELDKFDLVDAVGGSNSVAVNAVPTIQSLQKAELSQTAKSAAAAMSGSDPLTSLSSFEAEKATFDAMVDSSLADASAGLSGGAGWAFYADTDIETKLLAGHPGSEYTLTAMMVMVAPASDLQVLKEIFI